MGNGGALSGFNLMTNWNLEPANPSPAAGIRFARRVCKTSETVLSGERSCPSPGVQPCSGLQQGQLCPCYHLLWLPGLTKSAAASLTNRSEEHTSELQSL